MKNKHLIMGTAGHVDHGKTALIQALTGFNCDSHKQEQERGITINLGFTHLDLPDGNSIGIIDVPGHADFIKTMVAGASSIDFVLLLIAADEGIMPQTEEHLEIMKILGIKSGLVVLTKIDLVDDELINLAMEEIREFTKNSFLENSPIVKVSAKENLGLNELVSEIMNLVRDIPERPSTGVFRMYIDRIFSKEGFGTIVNGSILSGSISKEDSVFILPGEKEYRIRRIEHHGKEVAKVAAGDRASLNLVGFKQKDFFRGLAISDKLIKATNLIDVKFSIFQENVTLQLWNQVIFLLGTNRQMVRLHLLDKDYLEKGETALAQIYLPKPIIALIGDKFIIRNSSGNLTLGGGEIIDPYPLHHRRRRKNQIELVRKISEGNLKDIIAAEVRKSPHPIFSKTISDKLNFDEQEITEVIYSQLPGDIIFFQEENDIILLTKKLKTKYQNKILTALQEFHKNNPLKKEGKSFHELMGIFGAQQDDIMRKTLKAILSELIDSGKLKTIGKTWVLASHKISTDDKTNSQIKKIDEFLEHLRKPIDFNGLLTEFEEIQEQKLTQILNLLIDEKKVFLIQRKYFHAELINRGKQTIINYLRENKDEGITVAKFRDLMQCNRANTLILLEYFDNNGITLRKGNYRFLKKKYQ
ncbi:MAG: selenocysteine-specific translation elongation factor [Candidatus Cloacimonadota bacterium]|nr:MAG: selenocysteine-specific translation elongation factor [Candidatus Cloacimonadota bacterium]